MTLNEPQVAIDAGLREGRHAPGEQRPFSEVLQAAHHMMLAHGRAVQALRAALPSRGRIGLAPVGLTAIPATDDPRDVEAARAWVGHTAARLVRTNAWWMDPLLLGHYPDDGRALFAADLPRIGPDDMATIAQRLDFFGVNIYDGVVVRQGDAGPEALPWPVGAPITAFDWPVTPEALYWGPRFFHERYGLPILITEQGLSCRDWVTLDGAVHAPQRVDFLARYLRALGRAIDDGVPVQGYFHWTLMDNFEWAEGYKHRFGLVRGLCDGTEAHDEGLCALLRGRRRVERRRPLRGDGGLKGRKRQCVVRPGPKGGIYVRAAGMSAHATFVTAV